MEWCWVFVGSAGLTPVPHPTQTCLSLFFWAGSRTCQDSFSALNLRSAPHKSALSYWFECGPRRYRRCLDPSCLGCVPRRISLGTAVPPSKGEDQLSSPVLALKSLQRLRQASKKFRKPEDRAKPSKPPWNRDKSLCAAAPWLPASQQEQGMPSLPQEQGTHGHS